MAETQMRELIVAVRRYFTRYMQDEAQSAENCYCGNMQHIDALAVQQALEFFKEVK